MSEKPKRVRNKRGVKLATHGLDIRNTPLKEKSVPPETLCQE